MPAGLPLRSIFYVHCSNCLAGLASVLLYDSSAFFSSFVLRDTIPIAHQVGVPAWSLFIDMPLRVSARQFKA